jgi:hypothetical protein
VKKILSLVILTALVMSLAVAVGCAKGKSGGDAMVGTWGKVDNPQSQIKITKEGENYFYEGSQGKSPATKQDENTLLVKMGPIDVTVKLDPASGKLTVAFMGESYQYQKANK